jgi:hypothetical protein
VTGKLSKPRLATNKLLAVGLLSLLAALGLLAFQFGDRNNLNSMPFQQVKPLVAELAKAQQLAKEGNIELLAGQAVPGKEVTLRGEITDANCFLSSHMHAYDHAFCAKLCAAAGSPLLFLPDQGAKVYIVLTQRNGVPLSDAVLNQIGVPGIAVIGRVVESNGIAALAIKSTNP